MNSAQEIVNALKENKEITLTNRQVAALLALGVRYPGAASALSNKISMDADINEWLKKIAIQSKDYEQVG